MVVFFLVWDSMKTQAVVVVKLSRLEMAALVRANAAADAPADARAVWEFVQGQWCEANGSRARFVIEASDWE